MLQEEQVEGLVLDHIGLISATINKLGLIDKIDQRLTVSFNKGAKITMGERVAAMILNGTGFIDDRLYMFTDFLKNKPVDRLFRKDIKADYFTDDALGRCLDAIHEYGITKLFAEVAFEIGTQFKLLGKTARFDTTSLSVYGDYEGEAREEELEAETKDSEEEAFKVTYGYSKANRPDLKQMILNLATTGKANLPIWCSAHSGNASDKIILQKAADRMKRFADALKEAPSFIFVGDSAMYEKCVEKAGDMLWLSRVPQTSKEANSVLAYSDEELAYQTLDKGYKVSKKLDIYYKYVDQKWVVVFSDQKYEADRKQLDKKVSQEWEQLSIKIKKISRQVFNCETDAKEAVKAIKKGLRYSTLAYTLHPIYKHVKAGRPQNGVSKEIVGYKIDGSVLADESLIKEEEKKLGKFILATNALDDNKLNAKEMLFEYKEQTHTEAGFRFIKGNAFEVSSVFLKKESRIEALMMVMALCLLVYNLSEYFFRQALEAHKDSIPNQVKKPTKKPSMAYVLRLFHGIQVMRIYFGAYIQEIVTNLNELLRKIIRYFGAYACQIYGISL